MSFSIQSTKIKAQRTARYFISGTIGAETTDVWVVLHGYAQNAFYFLQKFNSLFSKNYVFIAPEGLSRFYVNGTSGKVGASWMTSEDREDEILDYIAYLNLVVEELNIPHNVRLNVLGFSQGAATMARWVNSGLAQVQQVVFYAGVFPPDVNIRFASAWANIQIKLVVGNQDPYYDRSTFFSNFSPLHAVNKSVEFIEFEGKHEIKEEVLRIILQKKS